MASTRPFPRYAGVCVTGRGTPGEQLACDEINVSCVGQKQIVKDLEHRRRCSSVARRTGKACVPSSCNLIDTLMISPHLPRASVDSKCSLALCFWTLPRVHLCVVHYQENALEEMLEDVEMDVMA